MNANADSRATQHGKSLIAMRKPKGVDMIDMPAVAGWPRRRNCQIGQLLIILRGDRSTSLGPGFDVVHLHVQYCRLNFVHSAIVSCDNMISLVLRRSIEEQGHASRKFRLIGDNCSGLAIGSEILIGIEAEAAEVSDRAGTPALVHSAMRLGSVLDYKETMAAGNRHDWIHVRHEPMQMGRHDRPRFVRNRSLDQSRVHRPGDWINVHKDRCCTAADNGGRRRDEIHRDRDHLIARPHSSSQQCETERRCATVNGAATSDAAVIREAFLERTRFTSPRMPFVSNCTRDRNVDLRSDRPSLCFQIQEGYQIVSLASGGFGGLTFAQAYLAICPEYR